MNVLHTLSESAWWQVLALVMIDFLLWGTILGGVLWALGCIFLSKTNSNIRYIYSAISLLALAVYGISLIGKHWVTPKVGELVSSTASHGAPLASHSEDPSTNLISSISDQPLPNATILANQEGIGLPFEKCLPAIWLAGSLTLSFLTLVGIAGCLRLRQKCQDDLATSNRCVDLAKRLGVKRTVRVAVSDAVATPLVLGIWRSVIVLPASLVTRCPADALEMILTHELMHVRRWDNAVNLLQRIVECVFFYQPFVWIFSNALRVEREHCCDEAVLDGGAEPVAYARLLQEMAEALGRGTAFELPLVNSMADHAVVKRIRRIMRPPQAVPLIPAWRSLSLLAASLLGGACLLWAQDEDPSKELEISLPFKEAVEDLPSERAERERKLPPGLGTTKSTERFAQSARIERERLFPPGLGNPKVDRPQQSLVLRGMPVEKGKLIKSPYALEGPYIDVNGILPGTKIKCPTTAKIIVVPGSKKDEELFTERFQVPNDFQELFIPIKKLDRPATAIEILEQRGIGFPGEATSFFVPEDRMLVIRTTKPDLEHVRELVALWNTRKLGPSAAATDPYLKAHRDAIARKAELRAPSK